MSLRLARPQPTVAFVAAIAIVLLAFGAPLGLTRVSNAVAGQPEAILLEIDSTISITRLNDASVSAGRTTALGRIRLALDPTSDLWKGQGDLASTTSSGPAACNGGQPGLHVEGSGTYNWVAEVGIDQDLAYAVIDARDPIEEPDVAILNYCTGSNSAMYNTWENLFFSLHQADYGSRGMFVANWTILATGSSWADGELIATAQWHGDCEQAGNTCSESTQFRLFAEGTAGPTAAIPTARQGNPGGSAVPGGSAEPGAAPSATPVANPTASVGPAPSPTDAAATTSSSGQACVDLAGCVGANWPIVVTGVVLLALLTLYALKVLLAAGGSPSAPPSPSEPLDPENDAYPDQPPEQHYDPKADKPAEQRYDPKADKSTERYDPKADKPAEQRYDPKADKPPAS